MVIILSAEADIDVVADAATGRDVVAIAQRPQPDVVLMDTRMPLLDGLAATRELSADPNCASWVLILTTSDGAAVQSLSPGETEVLRRMADGLNNEIVTALSVSEATIKTHIARILGKLAARDREGAVITPYRSGLVHDPPVTRCK